MTLGDRQDGSGDLLPALPWATPRRMMLWGHLMASRRAPAGSAAQVPVSPPPDGEGWGGRGQRGHERKDKEPDGGAGERGENKILDCQEGKFSFFTGYLGIFFPNPAGAMRCLKASPADLTFPYHFPLYYFKIFCWGV